MREDSELPPASGYLTVKKIAEKLDMSERMVHTYIQDGRLPGYRLGKLTVVKEEDFQAFERAKKGRPRTRLPIWRKSVGDNIQYMTLITARIRTGQRDNFAKKLDEIHAGQRERFRIVAGRAGADRPDAGAIVCSCFSVGANQIAAAVAGGCTSVEAIGSTLKAGTNCGSCRAEIRAIIQASRVQAAE